MKTATRAQMAAMRNLGIPVDLDHPPTFDEAVEAIRNPPEPIPSANDLGPLPPVPKEERRYLGASSIPTVYEAFKPHVATLPTGERVDLPAGTVLREGTLPPDAEDDRPTLGEQIHEEHERTQ